MKHLTRKLLPLVLALVTMGVLLTTALAANTDTLILDTFPEDPGVITISEYSDNFFAIFPEVTDYRGRDVTDNYDFYFDWTLNGVRVSTIYCYEFPLNMNYAEYELICSVLAINKNDNTSKTASVVWYPTFENVHDITLTVSESLGFYYFTSNETYTGTSVYDEICQLLNPGSAAELSRYEITMLPTSSIIADFNGALVCKLNDLDEVFLSINSSGTWTTAYYVTLDKTEVLSGLLTIEIEPHVSMDAFFSATPGDNCVIDVETFYEIWTRENGGRSTLESIYITGCSGLSGNLCYDHSATEKSHTNTYGLFMYASPAKGQKAMADLTFIPTKTLGKYPTGAVTISFQANGKNANKLPITLSGSIMIFYNAAAATDITYNVTGTHIMFNSDDFNNVYRAVTGTNTKKPIYTIRFIELPVNGTIYRNYNTANLGIYGSTALTDENMDMLTFSSTTIGESSLDKLAYVPTRTSPAGDSATYIVYNGTKILYVGTIRFTSREFVVTYTTSSALNFASKDFYTGTSPLLNAQYISFGKPSSGTLYKDYANGVTVQNHDYFSYTATYGVNLLDNITYVPSDNYLGAIEIPFSAQDLFGGVISGKVRIYVVRDVFADVDPSNWAAPYINRLYATGIVKGTSNGTTLTFSPDSNMKYGEALKMILNAAGYPAQSEPTTGHWASNYLNLAYQQGIVSTKNIDLNAAVDRNTVAELAAKALGLEKATGIDAGIVAPTDSTNGYVYALYNAGILNGSFVGGSNVFLGNNNITRAEVAKIICSINDYTK